MPVSRPGLELKVTKLYIVPDRTPENLIILLRICSSLLIITFSVPVYYLLPSSAATLLEFQITNGLVLALPNSSFDIHKNMVTLFKGFLKLLYVIFSFFFALFVGVLKSM